MPVASEPEIKMTGDIDIATYQSSRLDDRLFCKKCGSSLGFRTKEYGYLGISAKAFDDVDDFVFTDKIFIDHKPPFYAFSNDTKKTPRRSF